MGATMVRRAVTVAAAVVLGAGGAAVPATAAQAGGKYGPYLVAELATPTVKAGTAKWVRTWWSSRSDVCDVRVTVTGDDVAAVTYPSNTATFTSLSRGADLARGAVDYTAFRVTAAGDAAGWTTLNVAVSYIKLPEPDADCTGRRSQRSTTAQLFVRPAR